jgi:hypothetical protein
LDKIVNGDARRRVPLSLHVPLIACDKFRQNMIVNQGGRDRLNDISAATTDLQHLFPPGQPT